MYYIDYCQSGSSTVQFTAVYTLEEEKENLHRYEFYRDWPEGMPLNKKKGIEASKPETPPPRHIGASFRPNY